MVEPRIWGPPGWFFLHVITLNYPSCPNEEDKQNMKQFFESLQRVLPCKKCQRNFGEHLVKHPLTDAVLCSKKELIKWLIDVHNEVNVMTGKPVMGYDEAVSHLVNVRRDTYDVPSIVMVISVVVLLLLGVFFAYSVLRKKRLQP